MVKSRINQIPKKLASFSNVELYFIITELLGLNKVNKKLIVEGSLYIKPSSNSIGEQLTFLFINKSAPFFNSQENSCSLSIGSIDAIFSNIHLHTISFADLGNGGEIDIATIKAMLSGLMEPIVYRPAYLIDGILKIINQPQFEERSENTLFKTDLFENPYSHYFDLGKINDVDYSGIYYRIAQSEKKSIHLSTIIHHYEFEDSKNHHSVTMPSIIKKDYLIDDTLLSGFGWL